MGLDIYETNKLADLSLKLYDHPLTVSNSVRDIKIHIHAMQRNMMNIFRAETPEQLNEAVEKVNAGEKKSLRHFDTVEEKFLGDKRYIASARRDFTNWRMIRNEVIELIKQGRREEAIAIIKGKGAEHISLINEGVDGKTGLNYLINFADAKALEFRNTVGQKEKRGITQMFIVLWLTVFLVVILLTFSFRFLKSSAALANSEQQVNQQNKLLDAGNQIFSKALTCKTVWELGETCLDVCEKLTESKFGFIGELNSKGLFDTIAISNPGWDVCKMSGTDKVRSIKNMKISGVDRSTLREENSRIVNDPASHPDRTGVPKGHPQITSFLGVPLKEDGKTIGMIGLGNKESGYDTTDQENVEKLTVVIVQALKRKRAEETLRESEEKYHNLIEHANDAVVSMNQEGMVVTFNKKAEEVYGYTCEEILGKSILLLVPPQYREQQKKSIENFKTIKVSKMQGRTVETKGFRRDGREFPTEVSIFGLETKEGSFFTSFVRDITERKEMEHKLLQSEKLKSLGELAGGVAHDFNNVLAAILGRAQLLKMIVETPPGEEERRKSVIEMKEGLEVIEKASRDGAETVRRIQEFARRRDDDKHFTTVDLNEIVDNALDFTRMKWKNDAESKGIQINIQKELSILPTTSGSAAELREVLTNLINNAVDAMPQGGQIKIKTFKENSHVSIKVEDTGIGIPRALKDRIFDPFFTTKGVQSTGLGMSVSYGIINRHRGTITVDSVEGQGTTFTIKLPISDSITKEEKVKRIEGEPKKAKIMVIEDEEDVRYLLSDILTKVGHEVETATNGSQGIEMFEKKEFDLVFTDLGMPGMSGWQVAEKVKGINGRVPVVLITGWNIELKEPEIKDKWVDLIIQKPFEMNQVLNTVQEGMILRDRFKSV